MHETLTHATGALNPRSGRRATHARAEFAIGIGAIATLIVTPAIRCRDEFARVRARIDRAKMRGGWRVFLSRARGREVRVRRVARGAVWRMRRAQF